ncbi:MAG: phycobiliprotein lyase [Chroococcidiopsidaceae cyanobacterium CP_BM_RX_35]|nr:phycobiliprotein lyase [Chroococcidiopsidaceae cyanobacterium CP_BM_RX_35]
MTLQLQLAQAADESLIAEFFQFSSGRWRSQRRYYTLPDGNAKEMVSLLTIRFLERGDAELQRLAQLHELSDLNAIICGATVSWESQDSVSGRKESRGSTLFGARGNTLYRDRGFATSRPVTAEYHFPNPKTLYLRTEYNDSVFEEEFKLIGSNYRTRQTIISRAGEQLMIGQYLERRMD